MAVKIRMTRMGRRHRPYFRINAIESRAPRDGRILEKLGHYDPLEKDVAKQIVLERERIEFWLEKGAVPSETVAQILQRHGIKTKHADERNARRAKARAIARSRGKLFDSTERIVAEKKVKAEAEAKEAAEKAKAEAAKAAEEKAKAEAEAKEAAEKAKGEAKEAAEKAKAEAEAEAKEKAEAKAKAKAEAEAKEKAEAEAKAKVEPKAAKAAEAEAPAEESAPAEDEAKEEDGE